MGKKRNQSQEAGDGDGNGEEKKMMSRNEV